MIGVVCPSQFEYEVLSHAQFVRKGVKLIHSGMGKLRAAHACHRLVTQHGVRWILLIGFAGGLANLKIGDVVEPDTFIEQDYFAEPFEKFPNRISKNEPSRVLAESKPALMLTQDRFLTENPYKDGEYARMYEHIACDMESYAVAHFCKESNISYSIVKLISDAADEKADKDFLESCQKLSPKLNAAAFESIEVIKGLK